MFDTYGKSVVAFVYACAVIAVPFVSGDGGVDVSEGVAIAIGVVTAVMTWLIPLAPGVKWTKTAVGAVLAALQVAATVVTDGVDSNDWLLIAFALLSAAGIALAPAASSTGAAVGFGSDK